MPRKKEIENPSFFFGSSKLSSSSLFHSSALLFLYSIHEKQTAKVCRKNSFLPAPFHEAINHISSPLPMKNNFFSFVFVGCCIFIVLLFHAYRKDEKCCEINHRHTVHLSHFVCKEVVSVNAEHMKRRRNRTVEVPNREKRDQSDDARDIEDMMMMWHILSNLRIQHVQKNVLLLSTNII